MRPHRLRMTAFGPFADSVEVDFDNLAGSGLFLLHGETGAGKTSLLDGISFALYGTVPGQRGKARRLRSDHAIPDQRTEVRFEATLGGRRLRVTRSPEQHRPKRRGQGTTAEPTKVLLEEMSAGRWVSVSTRVGEADAEIQRLMGMSAAQFQQVVVLPQGDFARFLRAGAEERADLLERLFETHRFGAVEDWLANLRRETAEELSRAQRSVDLLATRAAQAAGVDLPAEGVQAGWATELCRTAARQAAAAEAAARARQTAVQRAQAALEETRALARRQARRAEALAAQDRLAAAAPEIAELRAGLDAARRAGEVVAIVAASDDAAASAERAGLTAAESRAAARKQGAPSDAGAELLRRLATQAHQRLGALRGLESLADQITRSTGAAVAARARVEALDQDLARVTGQLHALPELHEAAERRHSEALAAANGLPAARLRCRELREAADLARDLRAASGLATRLDGEAASARAHALDLREEAQALRETRFDSMVAELAHGLADETPCPVCGSLDHPEPADVRGEPVTREQEQKAVAAAEAARGRAEHLREQHVRAAATVDALEARLRAAGHADAIPEQLEEAAVAAAATEAGLRSVAEGLAAAEGDIRLLRTQERDLRDALATHAADRDAAQHAAEAAEAEAGYARAALAEKLDGAPDLTAAVASARAAIVALQVAADAVTEADRAAAKADAAAVVAARAARDAGFVSVDEVRAAQQTGTWRADAERRISEHEREEAAITGMLADPELAVALEPRADPAVRDAALGDAQDAHEAAAALVGSEQQRATALSSLAPQVEDAVSALGPLRSRHGEVKALADLAAGQGANALRMTLSAFVLAARLEEVAAVASQRLLRMSAGRYSLVHSDATRGGGRSGLGLLVRDAWTGQDRDTATLSGGETFLASLALALALADVVTSEAGGTRIEALFIDEGFGTLDEATLDEVMDVIDGLREGGRLVGLVSHVAELRQRIPAQVHVIKGRGGSVIRCLTA